MLQALHQHGGHEVMNSPSGRAFQLAVFGRIQNEHVDQERPLSGSRIGSPDLRAACYSFGGCTTAMAEDLVRSVRVRFALAALKLGKR